MNDAIDFIGGAMGAGAGTDLTLRQHGRDEGQLRRRPADAVRHGAAARRSRRRRSSGSGSRCCRACRSASRIRSTSPTPCSIGSSTASIRTACRRPARRRRSPAITRDDLVAFHQRYFVPNNAILAIVGDVTAEEAFDGVEEGVRRLGAKRDVPRADVHRAARPDAARRSSSTSRTRCRPRSASATSASRATIRTTWRSTSRSASSAARAATACTRCCAPSAG